MNNPRARQMPIPRCFRWRSGSLQIPNRIMKNSTSLLALTILISCRVAFGAPSANDLAGNWKGTLEVGSAKLRLVFKISKAPGGAWTAKMDSLDQGARDIPVDTVTVKDNTLRLEVNKVQGVYEGTTDKAGRKTTGQWRQGPQSLPLTLERGGTTDAASGPETLSPSELSASKKAAEKLAGVWSGTLAVGAANLRLKVNISKTPAGAATGTMDSLDQGAKDIPLSAITLKGDVVRFDARGIGGSYEGALATDSAALTGKWHQGGQSMPMDLKKGPATPRP